MLVEHLETYYRSIAAKRQGQSDNPFRASAMGHCIRKGCFDLLGLKGKPLQPRRIAVFKHGDWTHDNLTEDLKQALGWRFVEGLAFKDNFVEIDGAKISYHIDGAFQHETPVSWASGSVMSIGIIEIKSMSDFAFDRARKGEIDREYLAQAWVYWKGTDFNPVVFICYRKETSHMVEIIFDRHTPEKIFTQRLTGDPIQLATQDPLLVTEIRTPFDPSVEEYVRERIRYLKEIQSYKDDLEKMGAELPGAWPALKLVPGADAVTEEIENIQGKEKAMMRAVELGCEMPQRNGSWYPLKTGRKIIGYPCGYCPHLDRCFPNTRMEMDKDRPIWVVSNEV